MTRTPPVLLIALSLAACGSSSDEEATPSPIPSSSASPSATPVPVPETPPAAIEEECAVGYSTPFTPTRQHIQSSRAALAIHRREEFAQAVSAFQALVQEAPGYGSARFNLACAQTRAGQLEEAKATLTRLLCEDLPTNLPRALADEDLAPLRQDIEALGAGLVDRYREASVDGVSLVAFGRTPLRSDDPHDELVWSQPGFWKDARFIPAGPRLQGRRSDSYDTPMFPSFIAADRVVQVETVSSAAEADFLPPLRVVERGLFDGAIRSEQRFDERQNDFFGVYIGVHEGQTYVTFDSRGDPSVYRTHALTTRAVMPNPPLTSARIEFGMSHWTTMDLPEELALADRGRSLQQGERSIELGADRWRRYLDRLIANEDVAILFSSSEADCESPGPGSHRVEVIDLESGSTVWKESGEGQGLFQLQGGHLWLQTNDALFVFDDTRETERSPLPTGLGLSSCFLRFNPMC